MVDILQISWVRIVEEFSLRYKSLQQNSYYITKPITKLIIIILLLLLYYITIILLLYYYYDYYL